MCRSVLVVDDDEHIRDALSSLLEDEGHAVLAAPHGRAALALLEACPPEARPCLILLDLMMPVMDGLSFRDAQRENAAIADIPVVIITASGQNPDPSYDFADVLQKPLGFDRLVETIERYCPSLPDSP